jgi:tetratricopeptide (TPR) repeat protein
MALSRFSINLVFALIVAVLGLTAGIFIFRNSGRPGIQTETAETNPPPEKHLPVDEANQIAELQQMRVREPNNPEYPAQIGNLYYDTGQYEKAVEYYQQSLNIRPGNPSVETDLATCFHYLGQDDKSLEILDHVLGYNSGFEQAKYNKGIVLIEGKKDIKGGISVWEDLLRANPGYRQRAELEQRIDQLKASIR